MLITHFQTNCRHVSTLIAREHKCTLQNLSIVFAVIASCYPQRWKINALQLGTIHTQQSIWIAEAQIVYY